MTPIQLHRLAGAIATLRPDWPAQSVQTFLERHFTHRPYRDVGVALTYVALDPATTSPGRVLEAGPWWNLAASRDVPTTRNDCERHPGYPMRVDARTGASRCSGCHADETADETAAAHFERRAVPVEARRLRLRSPERSSVETPPAETA